MDIRLNYKPCLGVKYENLIVGGKIVYGGVGQPQVINETTYANQTWIPINQYTIDNGASYNPKFNNTAAILFTNTGMKQMANLKTGQYKIIFTHAIIYYDILPSTIISVMADERYVKNVISTENLTITTFQFNLTQPANFIGFWIE